MANLFPPKVTASQGIVQLGRELAFHKLIEVEDLDGDAPLQYRVRDNGGLASSGQLKINGQTLASNTWHTIPAAQWLELKYSAGLSIGNESYSVQAYDGLFWSQVASSDIFSVVDNRRAPRLTASNTNILEGESILASELFDITDPDGFPITRFLFVDRLANGNGGYWMKGNVRMPSAQWFFVDANELSDIRYVAGAWGDQVENVSIRGFDTEFWSATQDFAITTKQNKFRPTINALDLNASLNQTLQIDSMFTWNDQDGNTPKFLSVYDTGPAATSGAFYLNDVRQDAQKWVRVPWNQRSQLEYRTPNLSSEERVLFRIEDSRYVSRISSAAISVLTTPEITATLGTEITFDQIVTVNASSMINQSDDGVTLKKYELIDFTPGQTSGKFIYQGRELDTNVVHEFTAAEFANVTFQSGLGVNGRELDEVAFRAKNANVGGFWTDWQRININTDPVGAAALESGTEVRRWNGSKHEIRFHFFDDIPTYWEDATDTFMNPSRTTGGQRLMFYNVFDLVESVIDVDYIEVNNYQSADVVIGRSEQNGSSAFAFYPFQANGTSGIGSVAEDISIATNQPTGFEEAGSFLFSTMIHEVGHTLGSKHPFEEANNPPPYLPASVDFDHYTTMSYTGSNLNPGNSASFMLWDLVRLQSIYGANTDFESGNTQWRFERSDTNLQTLWDGGGIDTLNYSNQVLNATIDLRQGQASSLNGVANSLWIAYDAVIENARGSRADDNITGNESNNRLYGNEGNDVLRGLGGNDVLRGGAGNDRYIYTTADGNDRINEERSAGRDVLEIYDVTSDVDSLENDFVWRVIDNQLRVDLTINRKQSQGSIIIDDFQAGGSKVEILRLYGINGDQIGGDIELNSIFLQADAQAKRFRVTEFVGDYGFLAVPV